MKKLLSISAIIGVMTAAIIVSLLALDLIDSVEAQDVLFKLVYIIGIYSIAAIIILLITGLEKKPLINNKIKHEDKK